MNEIISTGYRSVIERAAADPNIDIDKLERLVAMQEASEIRQAEFVWNTSMAKAQADMTAVSVDSGNPQTRSKYASIGALDRAIRPHYTKHGFAVSFNEEASGNPAVLRMIAFVTCGAGTKRYMRELPITAQGIRSQSMMTAIHANASAQTYARRYLLHMIFNLAWEDDDGNAAGKRYAARENFPRYDRSTGEVQDRPTTDALIDAMREVDSASALHEYRDSIIKPIWHLVESDDRVRLEKVFHELAKSFTEGGS